MAREPRGLPAPRHNSRGYRQSAAGEDYSEDDTVILEDLSNGESVDDTQTIEMPTDRPDMTPGSSMDTYIRLRNDISRHEAAYMRRLQEISFKDQRNRALVESRMNDLKGRHKAFALMMILSMIAPLRNGMNINSVCETVGMGAAMWLLSPNFRKQVGSYARDAKAAIIDRVEKGKDQYRKEKHASDYAEGMAAIQKKGSFDAISPRLQRRFLLAEQYHDAHIPFSERSAGLTYVGLTHSAFLQMRQPGANPEQVRETYHELIGKFWDQVDKDGIDRGAVERSAMGIIGHRMVHDPDFACIFVETAHSYTDQVLTEHYTVNGVNLQWDGKFYNREGQCVTSGLFTLRGVMSADEHRAAIADTIYRQLDNDVMTKGLSDMATSMYVFADSWHVQQMDPHSINSSLIRRAKSASGMFTSMAYDGINPDDQRIIYADAYVEALTQMSQTYPGLERGWVEAFSENWEENARLFVQDPEAFKLKMSSAQADHQGVPTPNQDDPGKTYQTSRENQHHNAFDGHEKELEVREVDDGFEMGE